MADKIVFLSLANAIIVKGRSFSSNLAGLEVLEMAIKELTIAVLLTIVVGNNSGSCSNYLPRPVFIFKFGVTNPPKPPVTLVGLRELFDAVGYTEDAWTRARAVVNSGRAAVDEAFGSYPARAQAALQALADASPKVAQQFYSADNQFNLVLMNLENGMNNMLAEIMSSIYSIVFTPDVDLNPLAIQQLTNLFDVLHYLANMFLNLRVRISPGTNALVKYYIAVYHHSMVLWWNEMIRMLTIVVNLPVPRQNMSNFAQLLYSKIMGFDVKPCSAPTCVRLSRELPNIKARALNTLRLFLP